MVPRAGLPRRKERRQEGRRAGREVAGTGGGSYARLVPGNTEPAEGAHFGCPATRSSAWGRGLQALPAGGFRGKAGPPRHVRPLAPPIGASRRGRLRLRSGLPSESGLGTSGNWASIAAALVPTLKSGFAGLVSAPFFQGHVLPFLKGRPRLFLFPPRRYPRLVSCDRGHGEPGLPALLRARARRGLLGVSQRRRPSTLGCRAAAALRSGVCFFPRSLCTYPPVASTRRILGRTSDGGAPPDI